MATVQTEKPPRCGKCGGETRLKFKTWYQCYSCGATAMANRKVLEWKDDEG